MGVAMPDDDRLDRIERKLDTMAEAIVTLARMEERMVTLFRRMDSYDEAQTTLAERVNKLERHVGTNGQALRFAERLFWIIAAGAIGWFFAGGSPL
jgi:anti-sigma factor RsiW